MSGPVKEQLVSAVSRPRLTAPGVILVAIPVLILAAIVFKGRVYDPAYFTPPESAHDGGRGTRALPDTIEGWRSGDTRWLPDERMYEVINGKAQFYQKFGVEGLHTGTWANGDAEWQMFLYVMDSASAAEGAFFAERPESATRVEAGTEAYTVPGAVMVQAGQYYLQLVAVSTSISTDSGLELARRLLGDIMPVTDGIAASDAMLPEQFREPGSDGLHAADAFGYTSLSGVHFASYTVADESTTWFIVDGDDRTVSAYRDELARYGAKALFAEDGGVGGDMYGSWEILGVVGGVPIGVRGASSREVLMNHWRTWKQLKERQP